MHNCKEKSPSELSWVVWAPVHTEACIILLSGLCSNFVRSSLTLGWICVIYLDVRKDNLGCQYCCCCFCGGKDTSWFHLKLPAVSMRVRGNAAKEFLRTQFSFMWQLLSSPSHTGWAHGGGSRQYLNPAHIDPAACESMPVKDKCSGGRRKGCLAELLLLKRYWWRKWKFCITQVTWNH